MSAVELNENLLIKIAGWDVIKQARNAVAAGKVLSSDWQAPLLRGVYSDGSTSLRSGLVIKDAINVENLCPCRQSREWGTVCAHSVAVGLHWLKPAAPAPVAEKKPAAMNAPKVIVRLKRAGEGATGVPLRLHFLLPPNFATSAGRSTTAVFEAEFAGGRVPLGSVPRDAAYLLSAGDHAVLTWIEDVAEKGPPAMLVLDGPRLGELLAHLVGHPRITLGRKAALQIHSEPLRFPLRARLLESGEIQLERSGTMTAKLLATGERLWALERENELSPVTIPGAVAGCVDSPVRIARRNVPQFLAADWPKLVAGCAVTADFLPEDFELLPATPRFRLHLAGGLAMLQATLECTYGDRKVTPGDSTPNDAVWIPDPQIITRYTTRNLIAEREAVERLSRHGFSAADKQGVRHLRDQNAILNFFAREFPRLEKEWNVTLEERLERSTKQNLERVEPVFRVMPSGEQWFELRVDYRTSAGDQLSPAQLQQLLLSGRSHGRSRSGKHLLVDTGAVEELQEILLDAGPQQGAGGYRLDGAQAAFIDSSLRHQGWTPQAPEAWRQRTQLQERPADLPLPPLGALENVLRPYQKHGVAWLLFLRRNGFGGILADEMGLGKTLQVLTHLDLCRAGTERKAHLVVCPTSLVGNWAAESAKFTPGLRVSVIHGADRAEKLAAMSASDLVVTSYALLRRDFEHYRAFEFDTVVLDEAQHIKNRDTQNAQAVKALRSRHRLVLTGTPVENSILDLWSIFDFLMPGYLGQAKDFRERYELPLMKLRDAATQERLTRRVRPFILRRLKREVAPELPEKIEQVAFCEMSDAQRVIYRQLLEAGRREVLGINDNSLAKNRMVMLTTLLRLRQVCCDPRLIKVEDAPSAKTELFRELLDEVIDGGHRVLVFSQFTQMLGLLREHLEADGVECCYLDGSTRDRAAVVEKFQRDARIPVFLISLKAGGVGLNLTGADTVIHFDPWWNPAVEAQATDRAHRIGQRRVVTSYKLIARDSVEEKILKLQERKRTLLKGILADEEALMETLTLDDMRELLAD